MFDDLGMNVINLHFDIMFLFWNMPHLHMIVLRKRLDISDVDVYVNTQKCISSFYHLFDMWLICDLL